MSGAPLPVRRKRCARLGHKWVTRVTQQWVAGVSVVQSWAECERCGALQHESANRQN